MADIDALLNKEENKENGDALAAMRICLEGVNTYALHLSRKRLPARRHPHPILNARMNWKRSRISAHAYLHMHLETLDEAVNALWIMWVALHMENTNTGLSLGRLDQWLQPFFERDMEKSGNQGRTEKPTSNMR